MIILLFMMSAWSAPQDPCLKNLLPSSTVARVAVGSFQDPPNASGFFNHLAHQIARSAKWPVEVQTNYEYTEFRVLSKNSERHEAMADLMRALYEPDLTTSSKIIEAQFKLNRNDPDAQILSLMRETADPKHPFSRVTEGSQQTLKKMGLSYLHEQHKMYFTPGNTQWVNRKFSYEKKGREVRLSYPELELPSHPELIEYQSDKNIFAVALQLTPDEDAKVDVIQRQLSNHFLKKLKDQGEISASKIWQDRSSSHQFLVLRFNQVESAEWTTLWAVAKAVFHSSGLKFNPNQIKLFLGRKDVTESTNRSNYFGLNYKKSVIILPNQSLYFDAYPLRPNPLDVVVQPDPRTPARRVYTSDRHRIELKPTRNKMAKISIEYIMKIKTDIKADEANLAMAEPYYREMFRQLGEWTHGHFEVSRVDNRFTVVYEGLKDSIEPAITLISKALFSNTLSEVEFEMLDKKFELRLYHPYFVDWFHDRLHEFKVNVKMNANFSATEMMVMTTVIQRHL